MRLFREIKPNPSFPSLGGKDRSTVVRPRSSGRFLGRQRWSALLHPGSGRPGGRLGSEQAPPPPSPYPPPRPPLSADPSLTSSGLFQPHHHACFLQPNPSFTLGMSWGGPPPVTEPRPGQGCRQSLRPYPGRVSAILIGRGVDPSLGKDQ